MSTSTKPERLLRLPQVLDRIPVAKPTWWAGVASGRFPASVKIGGVTCWKESDIDALIRECIEKTQAARVAS